MPDLFSQLYETLTKSERADFSRSFLNGNKAALEVKLFQELKKRKQSTTEELAVKIYGESDKNSKARIRQLRQGITDKLVDYVTQNLPAAGKSANSHSRKILNLADFLLDRHAPHKALHYLNDAQAKSSESKSSELLEPIFHYKLLHATALGIDPNEVYTLWLQNNALYLSYMHLLAGSSILSAQLADYRRRGVVPNQDELMREFYLKFTPNAAERSNPTFMLRLAQVFRGVMLSSKDYWRIEPFVRDIYRELGDNNCFTEADILIRRSFLFMLAQACFRNRHFDEAEEWLLELQRLMPVPPPRQDPDYARMLSLRASIYNYTDRCERAIELLRKVLFSPDETVYEPEQSNMQLNLSVSYFCVGDFAQALKQLSRLDEPHEVYQEKFGVEWIYKKRMIHVIILWELKQWSEAEDLLEALLADYAGFFSQELYQRAKTFMEFVLRAFREPDIIHDPAFHQEVRDARLGWGDREDIQAIFFFCWFRAWMLNQPFYPTFLARLSE